MMEPTAETYDVHRTKEAVLDWFDRRVHGKDDYNIIAIAGDVVVELGDEWGESDVKAAKDDMIDNNIPVYATRGTRQIRIGM